MLPLIQNVSSFKTRQQWEEPHLATKAVLVMLVFVPAVWRYVLIRPVMHIHMPNTTLSNGIFALSAYIFFTIMMSGRWELCTLKCGTITGAYKLSHLVWKTFAILHVLRSIVNIVMVNCKHHGTTRSLQQPSRMKKLPHWDLPTDTVKTKCPSALATGANNFKMGLGMMQVTELFGRRCLLMVIMVMLWLKVYACLHWEWCRYYYLITDQKKRVLWNNEL